MLQEALDELAGADPELERFLAAGLITNGLFALQRCGPAARTRPRRAPSRDRRREAAALPARLPRRTCGQAGGGGRPARAQGPRRRHDLRGDQPAVPYPIGAGLVPTSTVLAMADLDDILTVYEDALAEAHRHGSTLAFGAVKVFRAFALRWRGDLRRGGGRSARPWPRGGLGRDGSLRAARGRLPRRLADGAGQGSTKPRPFWPAPGPAKLLPAARACSSSATAPGACACCAETWPGASRRCSRPTFCSRRSAAGTPPSSRGVSRRAGSASAGRRDEAAPLAEEEVELARTGRPAGARRRPACGRPRRGGERGLELLVEAVDVLSGSPARLEHAKARPSWAPRFAGPTAARRRGAASSGTRSWRRICAPARSPRAESELLATGARPRRIALSGVDSLTPSERRVAELAAEGPTNREIAQALFVTQRTVEVHLTSIYRKLAISSRSQLAAALAEPARA